MVVGRQCQGFIGDKGAFKYRAIIKGGRGGCHQNLTKSRRGGVGGLRVFSRAINVQIPGNFIDYFEFKRL